MVLFVSNCGGNQWLGMQFVELLKKSLFFISVCFRLAQKPHTETYLSQSLQLSLTPQECH